MIEVVGIGAGGWESLGPAEQRLLRTADLVVGGQRHLALLPAVPDQRRETWPADLRAGLPELLAAHSSRSIVVLASGDPLLAGVGSTLVELFGPEAVRIHPAVSSVALARARMGWAAETVEVIRLRGDDVDQVRRWLFPGQRLIILSRDAESPAEVAALLARGGHSASTLTVLGNLGGADETRRSNPADVPALNVVCVEVAGPAPLATLATGRPDEAYEHDGQLTKRDARASALAHLMPRPGDLLWDVGAGAGSIGIEWSLSHPRCRAIAIERDHDRAKRIAANAAQLGVPGIVVVHGTAPDALHDLPRPDAIFVGGGASGEVMDLCWSALAPGGRLVVHAVTRGNRDDHHRSLVPAGRDHDPDRGRAPGADRFLPWLEAGPGRGAVERRQARRPVTVHFIGAGPGAADLLTVRAVSLIESSPVCVYAGTYVGADILAHCSADATLIDSQGLDLEQITEHLVAAHRAGLDVARLCSGDPSIFSAVAEQARRLDRAGVPWDVTPGVPAYAAAAALIGRELTVPEVTQTVILTRTQAASTAMPESESLARLAESRATLVLHLAIRHVRRLSAELVPAYGPDCPVVVVSRATQPDELILRGTLIDIADQVEAAGLRQAAVIMVGEALRAEGFVESHLYGKRTR